MDIEVLAIEIVREAIKRTPEDTGHLKGCYSVELLDSEDIETLTIINDCEYGVYVHEMVGLAHDNGQSKFLEHAINFVLADTEYKGEVNIIDNKLVCKFDYRD